ncbi:hypothetical protein LTR17_008753 [Elasticomyces elasticus]|nr:hypothetical protein LTR17_008753 [Elasticomyces elasticus]
MSWKKRESTEPLLAGEDDEFTSSQRQLLSSPRAWHLERTIATHVIVFMLGMIGGLGLVFAYIPSGCGNSGRYDQSIAESVTHPSIPTIRTLDYDESDMRQNKYRQAPSPEVDSLWTDLSRAPFVHINLTELESLGVDPLIAMKVPSDFHFGGDAFVAIPTIQHEVHCLDTLRKEIHFDHYYGDIYPDGQGSTTHQRHVNHCVHVLLQSIMCTATPNMIPLVWYEELGMAADIVAQRQCGDAEELYRWADEHSLGWFDSDIIERPLGQQAISVVETFAKQDWII